MKKISLIILGFIIFMLTSCKTNTLSLKAVCNYYEGLKSYECSAKMNMYRADDVICFNVNSSYLSPDYYMVNFSSSNNNEQIIVKNTNGVYVLSPVLNKQFQFDSDWPLNSSHAYLISAIVKDIVNDSDTKFNVDNDVITIESKISHKVNQNLTYMKFSCKGSDFTPISCNFYNASDKKIVEVTFISFSPNKELKAEYFDQEKIMTEKTSSLGEGNIEEIMGSINVAYLTDEKNKNTVVKYGDKEIVTYSGEKNYVVVAENIKSDSLSVSLRMYDDLSISSLGIINVSKNGISYIYKNKFISIYSNTLSTLELIELGHSISFVWGTKWCLFA